MPDFSTLLRDFGTGKTIIMVGVIALFIYAVTKGGSSNSKGGNSSSGSSSSNTPSAPPSA